MALISIQRWEQQGAGGAEDSSAVSLCSQSGRRVSQNTRRCVTTVLAGIGRGDLNGTIAVVFWVHIPYHVVEREYMHISDSFPFEKRCVSWPNVVIFCPERSQFFNVCKVAHMWYKVEKVFSLGEKTKTIIATRRPCAVS